MKLRELADALGAELRGAAGDRPIVGVAAIATAGESELVFAESEAAVAAALQCRAGAILTRPDVTPVLTSELADGSGVAKALLVTGHPRLAFARAAVLLHGGAEQSSIHPSAIISPDVHLEQGVAVGAYVVMEPGVRIGMGTRVDSGVVLGAGVRIGRRCHLYPRVVVYAGTELGDDVVVHAGAVLGGDGFGYVRDPGSGEYLQFPQRGRLVLEDRVEVGAGATIDRGALEETRIGQGSKLDNLVHVGHNVRLGRNVVIAAQTGISGSTVIGDDAVIGGQVGIGDHASIGERVILGSGSGVLPHKRLRGPGVTFWGTPARPLATYLREIAALTRLGRMGRTRSAGEER